MANISKAISDRDIHYYRQRTKNRFFEALSSFFAHEAEARNLSRRGLAEKLKRDPAQITRWLSEPSNLTLETISDLLLSLDAEMDPCIARFVDRPKPNFVHPLIAKVLGAPVRVTVQSTRTHVVPASSSSASTTGSAVDVEILDPV